MKVLSLACYAEDVSQYVLGMGEVKFSKNQNTCPIGLLKTVRCEDRSPGSISIQKEILLFSQFERSKILLTRINAHQEGNY